MSDRIIRAKEISQKTGLSRSTIWRLEREGVFPKRKQLAPHTVGWLESEVARWLESRQPADQSTPRRTPSRTTSDADLK